MNPVLKAHLLRYWLAMNASALKSGVHSARAFFGVAGAHALTDAVPALTLQQGCSVFLVAFGCELLNYLDTHPVLVLADGASLLEPIVQTPAVPASTATNQPK